MVAVPVPSLRATHMLIFHVAVTANPIVAGSEWADPCPFLLVRKGTSLAIVGTARMLDMIKAKAKQWVLTGARGLAALLQVLAVYSD